MQSENRIFDDLAKVLNGVAGTGAGMGREAEANMKERAREWAGGLEMVSREEFEAVKQMAANARAEADLLGARVKKLEAALKIRAKPAAKPKAKRAAKHCAETRRKSQGKACRTQAAGAQKLSSFPQNTHRLVRFDASCRLRRFRAKGMKAA